MDTNDRTPAVQAAEPADYDAEGAPVAVEEATPSPFAAVHRILRGRYKWAVGIGLVLGAVGATLGFMLPKPLYRSAGLIEIAPKVQRIVYETEEKGVIPMFDAFIMSEVTKARGRRVVDMVMRTPEWRGLGRGNSDAEIEKFFGQLEVGHPQATNFVEIAFTDEDPAAAYVTATQVIKAYMRLVEEYENETSLYLLHKLENERTNIISDLNDNRRDAQKITDDLGIDAFEKRYQAAIDDMNKMEAMINDLDVEVVAAKMADEAATITPGVVPSRKEIAAKDPAMAELLEQKFLAETSFESLRRGSLGENHPAVAAAAGQVALFEWKITQKLEAFKEAMSKAPEVRAALQKAREAERVRLVKLLETIQARAKQIGNKRHLLEVVADERQRKNEELDLVNGRLQQINVESGNDMRGRITVAVDAEHPLGPSNDRRRQFALAAGVGGLALGFALVFLWGLRNAKLRHISDVNQGGKNKARFLGLLPEVTSETPEEGVEGAGEMADFCIHHVRTMLQLRAGGHPRVVALTSPSPGDGKTTLSMSLAMSFAASGSKTLLIDCDLVGRGLTSAMRSLVCDIATRALTAPEGTDASGSSNGHGKGHASKVAELLAIRQLKFDDSQLAELLAPARARSPGNASIARAVRALEGLVRPAAAAASGGAVHGSGGSSNGNGKGMNGSARSRRGILGALAGAPLESCVLTIDIPNLSLLPVGDAGADDAESLSPSALAFLLDACRARYDTVLVDTGPVLGSLEASLTGAAADYVVLVVSRGGKQPIVEEALDRLDRIGADVAGVVFNRAAVDDVAHSNYASRSRSIDSEAR